jgi:hypothetical protein
MAKTAAQRQAEYRARRPHSGSDDNGQRRLNAWIDTRAFLALARVARRYAVTKQELIDKLIIAEEERVLAGIDCDSAQWQEYFDSPLLRSNDERQLRDYPPTTTKEQRQI